MRSGFKRVLLFATLCEPSLPSAPVHVILQVRKLEWVAMPLLTRVQIPSLTSPALAGEFFTASVTWEAQAHTYMYKI